MQLISVKSSNISQLGFEKNKKLSMSAKSVNVLRVIFTNGGIYDYYEVEEETFNSFLKAKSIGSYFWKNIKDKYTYEKIK